MNHIFFRTIDWDLVRLPVSYLKYNLFGFFPWPECTRSVFVNLRSGHNWLGSKVIQMASRKHLLLFHTYMEFTACWNGESRPAFLHSTILIVTSAGNDLCCLCALSLDGESPVPSTIRTTAERRTWLGKLWPTVHDRTTGVYSWWPVSSFLSRPSSQTSSTFDAFFCCCFCSSRTLKGDREDLGGNSWKEFLFQMIRFFG